LREAYEIVEWPIIILLGALIPVSEAVRETGGTEPIAFWLAKAAAGLPALGGVALTLLAPWRLRPS